MDIELLKSATWRAGWKSRKGGGWLRGVETDNEESLKKIQNKEMEMEIKRQIRRENDPGDIMLSL